MENVLVRRFGKGKIALALPLLGLFIFWLATLVGAYVDLVVQYSGGNNQDPNYQLNAFHAQPYIMVLGYAALGFTSVAARSLAGATGGSRLDAAVRVFSLVFTIGSLIIGAILGIGLFMSNFMTSSYNPSVINEGMRVLNVYVPIILDAGVLVFLILRAFVMHTDDEAEEAHDA